MYVFSNNLHKFCADWAQSVDSFRSWDEFHEYFFFKALIPSSLIVKVLEFFRVNDSYTVIGALGLEPNIGHFEDDVFICILSNWNIFS